MDPSTKQEVTTKITAIIAGTLGVAPSELGTRDSLVDKYGIESLDILDISFRVNKEFGVKLFRGDFFQKASEVLGDVPLIQDGKLTQAAINLLKERLPEAVENPLLQVGAPRNVIIRLYCVDSWVRQICELRDAGETSGEAFQNEWLTKYKGRMKAA
jgi:acyl carrier protein